MDDTEQPAADVWELNVFKNACDVDINCTIFSTSSGRRTEVTKNYKV